MSKPFAGRNPHPTRGVSDEVRNDTDTSSAFGRRPDRANPGFLVEIEVIAAREINKDIK
jgi:hypothetical protein